MKKGKERECEGSSLTLINPCHETNIVILESQETGSESQVQGYLRGRGTITTRLLCQDQAREREKKGRIDGGKEARRKEEKKKEKEGIEGGREGGSPT